MQESLSLPQTIWNMCNICSEFSWKYLKVQCLIKLKFNREMSRGSKRITKIQNESSTCFSAKLHVIPIGDDAVLNGILQGQHTSLALRLVSYIAVLLVHANHDSRHLWPANNGWENCSWSIITCKAGLAHSASVVHHKRGNFFVTHGCENKGVLKGVAKWCVQNHWSPKFQMGNFGVHMSLTSQIVTL